ncbi:hypothetical protein PTSG_01641 [Salpingoeca rosetta]|uniref:Uncharacterized protein n=1 Tax=Salpingoeca rosetta (strain ATCC 50818 / BSB-021) TaxID=946362 RepID=F2TYI8_SALR5|nr:uncharacterized protein PTSG_01641 [Salpingoeca rosetta]EGD78662.1 hypothetical protein PTSG_01641 [Salpingoeca rosetta]|eukprot:XP_004997620.1 hypothetical protein PTSG_01641 [Salpingoeca rosetta]
MARTSEVVHDPAPLGRKWAFALGAFGSMATHTAVGFFLSPFLLEIAAVSPYIVSICTFLGRVWDAITDPVVGLLVSRTNTRWGSLKPWITMAIVPSAIVYFCFWIVPPFSEGQRGVYYIILYLLYQTFFSCYQVPYTALTMHISRDPKQRDQATAFRMVIETLALMSGSAKRGYLISGGFVAVVSIVLGAVLVLGVPEDKSIKIPPPQSFWKTFKSLLKHKTYRTLTLMFLWAWMANNVNQTNFILWLNHGFGLAGDFQYFLITLLCTTTATLPLWFKVMNKIGKPLSFALGLVIQVPWTMANFFLPSDTQPWVIHLGIFTASIGLGAVYLIPWAMLPDVIDEAEWRYGTRKDSVYYSFFVFFQKFGSGIAISLSTLALNFADYKTKPCCGVPQPPTVRETLKYLVSVVPTILLFLSLLFTRYYELGPKQTLLIKQKLEERRKRLQSEAVDETVPLRHNADESPKSNGSLTMDEDPIQSSSSV